VALRLPKQDYQDIERVIEFDFVRATEAAALNSLRWLGRGDKEAADAAACDAMRGMFDLMNICGEVVIGEGIKDEAPGLFKGEKVGQWRDGSPRFEVALDPVDGTTNLSKGMPNSISCIAASGLSDDGKPCLRCQRCGKDETDIFGGTKSGRDFDGVPPGIGSAAFHGPSGSA